MNCNPNTIELLGLKEEHYLYLNDIGKELINNKKLFLSKRAIQSFGGYASAQLRRLQNALARDSYPQEEKEKHIYNSVKNAINTFNDNKNATFYTYAKTCVERRIISVVKAANRLKHQPLNDSYSVELFAEDGDKIEALLEDKLSNPEVKLFDSENVKEMIFDIESKLTDFESAVFDLKISGFTYVEIADILGKDKKAIDNAITRIKAKVLKYIEERKLNS